MEEQHGTMADHVAEKMAPALISVHPKSAAVVVAIGAGLRIFDFIKGAPVTTEDITSPGRHGEAIRAVAFNKEGNLFSSAGDDKLVKLWDTNSWTCIKTTRVAKKVTGVSFTQDSKWLLFADKFGVVFVIPTSTSEKLDEPVQLLAHCCSIITDLKMSPEGKYIVTADRDFKIRVSVLPAVPTNGAHEIWSYCLGHTSFVTCVAFVGEPTSQQLLVSGSGDATVRLWDYKTGELLDILDTSDAVAEPNDDGTADGNSNRAVLGVSVSPDGLHVAVIIERYPGVLLLEYDRETKKLQFLQILALAELFSPTSIVFDPDGRLWLVAGAAETVDSSDRSVTPEEIAAAESRAHAIAQTAVARVSLLRKFSSPSPNVVPKSSGDEEEAAECYELCDSDAMPGGKMLLQALQGSSSSRVDSATEEVALAAEAAELSMRKLLTKRQYTIQQRENRKRMRNDKKLENKSV
ncbi:unnamed protein product [Calypogeia fissa]